MAIEIRDRKPDDWSPLLYGAWGEAMDDPGDWAHAAEVALGWPFAYVADYEDGLAVNVMYTIADAKKRAVGFKLSEGMEVPAELEGKFKFARQKSKLAGTIRGSFFVIKGEY